MRERQITIYDESVLTQMRDCFFELNSGNLDVFEASDLKQFEIYHWFATRFLHECDGNIDKAVLMLTESFKWRKKMKFVDFPLNFYPDLIPKVGAFFIYENDSQGYPTMYARIKFLKKVPEMNPYIKHYAALLIWQMDEFSKDKGWILVIDFKDASYSQLDFELIKHFLQMLMQHFPGSLERVIVVDMPWVFRAFYAIIKTWLNKERLKLVVFVSRSNFYKQNDKDKISDFLGGTCTRPYKGSKMVPEGSPEIFEFGMKVAGISKERCLEIYAMYEEMLTDID